MTRFINIIIIILGIGSLVLIGVLIFIGTVMGKRADDINSSIKQDPKIELKSKDSIPQGKIIYELYFAEFAGRIENLPVEIEITGKRIIVYNNKENPLTGGSIIIEGILLKHKSGKWIIGKTDSDRNAEEIGGCTDGPTPIDFKTRIIEWC